MIFSADYQDSEAQEIFSPEQWEEIVKTTAAQGKHKERINAMVQCVKELSAGEKPYPREAIDTTMCFFRNEGKISDVENTAMWDIEVEVKEKEKQIGRAHV